VTRLSVPYISQLLRGSGMNNCGPACMAMMLAHRGVIAPTQDAMLEVADIARDGLSNNVGESGGYTTFAQLAMVANWYGQDCSWYSSWAQIGEAVAKEEPVIVLLDNRVLQPRQYPNSPAWNANHFILVTSEGTGDGNRYSSDPLSYYVQSPYFYTEASTRLGVASLGGPQALSLTPLAGPPRPPEPPMPEQVKAMSDWELTNFVLQPLYEWAGLQLAFNPDGGIQKTWVAALRAGVYCGRPRTGDREYGSPVEGWWAEFDHRVLVYKTDGTMSWNG
jgi:Peptidase_C39 like family